MKKFMVLLTMLALVFSLAACGEKKCGEKKEETTTEGKSETPKTETQKEENSKKEESKIDSSGVPKETLAKVEEINKKYDAMISQIKGFSSKPETYTMKNHTAFMTDYSDIVTDFGELSEAMNKHSNLSSWEGYDLWMSIMSKNSELLTELTKLPKDFAK